MLSVRERLSQTSPLIACAVTALGTLLAGAMLFPDQPAPRGALIGPAVVMAACIFFVPFLRIISGTNEMTNAENFVAVGYIFWLLLDLMQGAYDLRDASNQSLQYAFIAIGVSAAAMWLGVAGRPWRAPGWLQSAAGRTLSARAVTRMIPICFVLGMFNFAYSVDFDIPEMFSYLGAQRWLAPWSRGQLGGWGSFRDQMPYFGYVLPSLTALVIARRGLFRFESLLGIACSAIMLLFLSQGGGRRIIGVTCGAALMVWMQARPGLRIKNMIIVASGMLAMAWASQFILNIRTVGYEEFMDRGSSYDYLHVDDNFLRLAQTIQLVPAAYPYVGGQQVIYTVVRPVPRVFWPDKPTDPGFDLPRALGMKGVSLSTSIIGEWYLSWGWIAVVFGGWFHGRLAKAANGLREIGRAADNPIVYALAVMVLVSGVRSMLDLVIMSYALVAWWGVNRFLHRREPAVS